MELITYIGEFIMAKSIFNVFAFFGEKHENQKLAAAAICHEHGAMCATDKEGKPQAFFRLPVISKKRVLGRPRVEALEWEPTLLLEAPDNNVIINTN